jgi:hypothetical protein
MNAKRPFTPPSAKTGQASQGRGRCPRLPTLGEGPTSKVSKNTPQNKLSLFELHTPLRGLYCISKDLFFAPSSRIPCWGVRYCWQIAPFLFEASAEQSPR